MKELSRIAATELVVSFLIGGVPAIIAFVFGGARLLGTVVDDLLPKGFPVYYVFVLSVLALVATWLLKRTRRLNWLKEVLREVQELQSVYRLGAGFLLTFSMIWFFSDRPQNLFPLYVLAGYGVLGIAVSIAYSYFSSLASHSCSSAPNNAFKPKLLRSVKTMARKRAMLLTPLHNLA